MALHEADDGEALHDSGEDIGDFDHASVVKPESGYGHHQHDGGGKGEERCVSAGPAEAAIGHLAGVEVVVVALAK